MMATAKRIQGRRQQAWQRLPALLTAWVDVSKTMMSTGEPKEALIPGVVYNEIERYQGFTINYKYVAYRYLYTDYIEIADDMGSTPEKYDVLIVVTNRILPRIVKALRRAWREATHGERAPSFGGLNSAKGLRECLVASHARCKNRERAIRRVVEKIEETKARWYVAIDRYRKKMEQRRRRPTPADPVSPKFVIFETGHPLKFEIKFKDKRRSQPLTVKLTKHEYEIYRIVRERRLDGNEKDIKVITSEDLSAGVWKKTYHHLVRIYGKQKVHQNFRAVVSRFNRAWFRATGVRARILTALRKPSNTWRVAVELFNIWPLKEREQLRYSRRRGAPTE